VENREMGDAEGNNRRGVHLQMDPKLEHTASALEMRSWSSGRRSSNPLMSAVLRQSNPRLVLQKQPKSCQWSCRPSN
jgi:hypothetical protein